MDEETEEVIVGFGKRWSLKVSTNQHYQCLVLLSHSLYDQLTEAFRNTENIQRYIQKERQLCVCECVYVSLNEASREMWLI